MKYLIIGIQIFLGFCASLILAWIFIFPADSHYGFQYVMWKHGFGFFNAKIVYRLLNTDPDLRQSLIGTDRSKIKTIFPDAKETINANQYQAYYSQYLKDQDFLWLGESSWAVIFKDNKLTAFRMMKG